MAGFCFLKIDQTSLNPFSRSEIHESGAIRFVHSEFWIKGKDFSTPAESCSSEDASEEVKFEKLKVLLVEDHPMNQLYATAVLEGYCEEIIIANNRVEAIEKMRHGMEIDLILMDIQMPEMGGERCTEIIRNELGLSIPIVA